jgi:prevent-host-death family protein
MRTMTASEVSRQFSTMLDQAEHGETIVITRAGRRVAMLSPAPAGNGGALLDAISGWGAPDDPNFDRDLSAVRAAVSLDEDPWATA